MGREIAEALADLTGNSVRNGELCQHVGDICVVGAQGHLFALSDPDEYGEQFHFPWRVEPLPVLPERFLIEPNFEKSKGKVVNSDLTKSIRSRIARIKDLIRSADTVIHAGDPDREGQLIIDDILREFKFKGQVKRLWLHAQTLEGIQDAWRAMKDNKVYANLGLAAVARRESDWVIGMNSTRAFTTIWWKKGHKGILNIGRVVTPVVGLIVRREKEIESFVPTNHYSLRAHLAIGSHEPYIANWIKPQDGEGRPEFDPTGKLIIDRRYIESIHAQCNGKPAKIVLAETNPKRERAPLLFSLTELQKMAAKMGHSPDATLKAAQALYESHKLTSYPRTECQYAPESEHRKAPSTIKAILANFGDAWEPPAGWDASRKSAAFDDKKLGDHFAIIPLPASCSVSGLKPIERDVYKLICRQYLAQFFVHHEYSATTLIAEVCGHQFKATGRVPLVEGWRCLFGGSKAVKKGGPDSDEQDSLPPVQVGDTGIANPVEIEAKKTEPPRRFDAITLLDAMERAHMFVTDPKVKATLKQVEGIGTAATRAATIAKAVATDLIGEDRSGKVISYYPTPKGMGYVMCVTETLTKPDLTAWFEGKLEELADGRLQYDEYRKMLAKLTNHIIGSAKDGSALKKMPGPDELPAAVEVKRSRKASSAKRKSTGLKRASPRKAS